MAVEPEKSEKSSKTPLVAVYKEKPDLRKKEPPLVSVSVTNPITYIKSWWKKVMGREGIDLRFRIHPLTAIAIAVIIATFSFGVGRIMITTEKPFFKFVSMPLPTPIPTPDPWRETAFSGVLRLAGVDRYYLTTASAEAITLQIPENVDLNEFVGRRIFATGRYNEITRTLIVADASDLEPLPKKRELIPLVSPSPEPLLKSSASPSLLFPPEVDIIEEVAPPDFSSTSSSE